MTRRFACYIEKVFELGRRLAAVRDSRQKPKITTAAVLLCVVLLQATRLASLHAMALQMRNNRRWAALLGRRSISDDSMGRIVNQVQTGDLRQMLRQINLLLRRNKLLTDNPWPLRFVALDGHEFFSLTQSPLPGLPPAPAPGRGRAGR